MFSINSEGKLEVDPNVLMIPQFLEIWEADKTKDKRNAYAVLSGIYFLGDPESPYWDWEDIQKKKEIEETYFKEAGYKIKDKLIQEALKQYEVFIKMNPSQYLLEAAKETLYKLANHLKSVPITSGKDGNILQVSSTMDRLAKTFASYDTLKQAIEREKLSDAGKRGDEVKGFDED